MNWVYQKTAIYHFNHPPWLNEIYNFKSFPEHHIHIRKCSKSWVPQSSIIVMSETIQTLIKFQKLVRSFHYGLFLWPNLSCDAKFPSVNQHIVTRTPVGVDGPFSPKIQDIISQSGISSRPLIELFRYPILQLHVCLGFGQSLLRHHLFLNISLNLSSCTMLWEIFPNPLKSATISFLESERSGLRLGRPGTPFSSPLLLSKSPENRIFSAVPRPVTWKDLI